MRAKVDRERCTGVGNCVAVAPTVFKLDAENKAIAAHKDKGQNAIYLMPSLVTSEKIKF